MTWRVSTPVPSELAAPWPSRFLSADDGSPARGRAERPSDEEAVHEALRRRHFRLSLARTLATLACLAAGLAVVAACATF